MPIVVEYTDPAGTGFNDAALGEARRTALDYAVSTWAALLAGEVPVVIAAAMIPLGGSGSSAILASTGTVTVHRDFPGGRVDTWYGAALGNQLAGADLNGANLAEIAVTFNADVDGPAVLGSVGWYYGTDAQPGSDIDFVTVALHELGHGLNFFDLIDSTTGRPQIFDTFGVFEHQLERPGLGRLTALRAAERLAAITSGSLFWNGPNVLVAFRAPAPLYAPAVFAGGSSIAHWDTSLSPDEIIEPFYTGPMHDPGLLLPALMDMGWELAVPTATPRSTQPIVPTATRTASPTPTATAHGTPLPVRYVVYVTNFDSENVSAFDGDGYAPIATIRVGPGPLGAAVTTDGSLVYVANFHAGTLSVISTATNRVVATLPAGESANSVAVSPDGQFAYATDTFAGRLAVVDTQSAMIAASIPVGDQPAGVALTPDGRHALVAKFGGNAVAVVDTDLRAVTAILPLPRANSGPLSIAVGPRGMSAYLSAYYDSLQLIDLRLLTLTLALPLSTLGGGLEAVAISPDNRLYATTYDQSGGRLLSISPPSSIPVRSFAVGDVPEALAIRPDGQRIYVANTGSNDVSVFDVASESVVTTIEVGAAPMGIAVAAVPISLCAGDCETVGRVTIDDLVTGVGIALGTLPLIACERADTDGSETVTVGELVAAVGNALHGCR